MSARSKKSRLLCRLSGPPYLHSVYANVQRAKRDTVTADIYYYITTEFGYAKRTFALQYVVVLCYNGLNL